VKDRDSQSGSESAPADDSMAGGERQRDSKPGSGRETAISIQPATAGFG